MNIGQNTFRSIARNDHTLFLFHSKSSCYLRIISDRYSEAEEDSGSDSDDTFWPKFVLEIRH